jgi:hypothetical protein
MPGQRNYLGLGMVIGVTIGAGAMLAVFLVGPVLGQITLAAQAADTPTAATETGLPSPTATLGIPATFTPIAPWAEPTNLPSGVDLKSTPTPDPIIQLLNKGGLAFSGPLTNAQQIALYRASLPYIQLNARDSVVKSKEINGVGYGDPSNICGPLAIAILRDAGLLPSGVDPHSFWLLDPLAPTDKRILDATFPDTIYTHTKTTTPLNKMDWQTSPLEPGDFLFIWHGSWGNFDHMLVVNRVDSAGRAYAVTNFGTDQGYIIAETMLYDPADPKAGIFHTWTKERDAILGSTGFGGFELWRIHKP